MRPIALLAGLAVLPVALLAQDPITDRHAVALPDDHESAELTFKNSGYIQWQYKDDEGASGDKDMFRRIRVKQQLGYGRLGFTISSEWVDSEQVISPLLRDLYLNYAADDQTELRLGQFSLPVGYEIMRSSSRREFPERARYNRVMHRGERVRGFRINREIGEGLTAMVGVVDALTVRDREQDGREIFETGQVNGLASLTKKVGDSEYGVSGIFGPRPEYTGGGGTSPEIDDRYLAYAHAIWNLEDGDTVRIEAMRGYDRIASSTGSATRTAHNIWGGQIEYVLPPNNGWIPFARVTAFDPNMDAANDFYNELGLGLRYLVNKQIMITLSQELVRDQSKADKTRNITTVRFQYKF